MNQGQTTTRTADHTPGLSLAKTLERAFASASGDPLDAWFSLYEQLANDQQMQASIDTWSLLARNAYHEACTHERKGDANTWIEILNGIRPAYCRSPFLRSMAESAWEHIPPCVTESIAYACHEDPPSPVLIQTLADASYMKDNAIIPWMTWPDGPWTDALRKHYISQHPSYMPYAMRDAMIHLTCGHHIDHTPAPQIAHAWFRETERIHGIMGRNHDPRHGTIQDQSWHHLLRWTSRLPESERGSLAQILLLHGGEHRMEPIMAAICGMTTT
jgi:hypothetical protein